MKNSIRTAVIICFAFLGALPLRGQELSLEIPLWATPPTENNGLSENVSVRVSTLTQC